jgi:hypothetical protein
VLKKAMMLFAGMMGLLSCAGLTYPEREYKFRHIKDIWQYDANFRMGRMPTEYFSEVAFYLDIFAPSSNGFYYTLMPLIFLEEEGHQITIHDVWLGYNQKKYRLAKKKETFALKRFSQSSLQEYKLPLDSYYYEVGYMDEAQRVRMSGSRPSTLSIIPLVNLTRLFKEKIGNSFPVYITVSYQIDDGEIITHTSDYEVTVQKNAYVSYFSGY